MDEGIRERILKNIDSIYTVKAVLYSLLLAVVSGIMFWSVSISFGEEGIPPLAIALVIGFIGLGLIAVFYIYFSSVREKSAVVKDAIYMVVAKVVSMGDNNRVLIKLPGEKNHLTITCEEEMYKKAEVDVRILVVAASKRNSNQMYGVDPASYDKDGLL